MESLLMAVADYLTRQTWQVAVVFVVVATACYGLRKASAHGRYLLWLVVLAKCLTPGLVSVPLAVWPQRAEVQQAPVALPLPVAAPGPNEMRLPAAAIAEEREQPTATALPVVVAAKVSPHGVAKSAEHDAANAFSLRKISPRAWLAAAWCAGVAIFFICVWIKAWSTYRWLRRTRCAADPQLAAQLAALTRRLGMNTTPAIYTVDAIAQPFVWGWLRGSIYVPRQFVATGSGEQQQAILAHELAHVARWDAAANLVQIVVQALFFFHPLIWWTNRQIRRERENCCDETVIAGLGADPRQYGQAIVDTLVAEYEASRPVPSLAVTGRLKNIEDRIETILSPNRRFLRRPSWTAVTTVVLLAACAVPTALVLTVRGEPAATPAPAPAAAPSENTAEEPAEKPKADSAKQAAANSAKNKAKAKNQPKADKAADKAWQPGQTLALQVINAKTKQPLPEVKLELQFHGPGINFQDVKTQTTDAQGRSEIRLPDSRPDAVRVYPSKPGFVPLRVYWGDDLAAPKLPKSDTIALQPGTTWGGVIQDEQGKPIPDVKVTIHYWETSPGNYYNPHLRANIDEETTSDKDGRWHIDVMPAEVPEDEPRIFLSHPDHVSDTLLRGYTPMPLTKMPPIGTLREQTAVMVMRKGGTITGLVTDQAGKPIAGVEFYTAEHFWLDSQKPAATSDADGRFRLKNLTFANSGMNDPSESTQRAWRAKQAAVVMQAPGYTPQLIHVDPNGAPKPLEIKLKPGKAVFGRVVDANGKPLQGVNVSTSNWLGYRERFNRQAKTDAEGKFRLSDVPLEGVLYDFHKKGYVSVSDLPMSPDDKNQAGQDGYVVTLTAPLRVSGTIVDAQTNQPPARCTVTKGVEYDDGRAPEWERYTSKTVTNGRYQFEFASRVFAWRIRVEADGYMPAISPIFRVDGAAQGPEQTYDFKLQKAPPLTGTVQAPDGQPLADAEVYRATNLLVVEGRKAASQSLRNARMAKTDAAGRFELPPEVEPFYLVVLHERGFAVVNEEQFSKTKEITIKAWDKDQESFRAERSPVTHREPSAADKTKPGFTARLVDEDGKPVEAAVVGTYAARYPASTTFAPSESRWDFSPGVLSRPDGTARIAEKDYTNCVVARHAARKLVGMAAVSNEQLKQAEPITLVMYPECVVSGTLTAKELAARNHKLDWTNVYLYLNRFARPMTCSSHQSEFVFYAPPGTYTLKAYGTDTQHVRKPITIEPGQRELKVEPIDLPPTGLVLLEGKPAPELRDIVAWKNGGPLKLADLRGKVVILVFMPDELMWDETLTNLLAAYEKHQQQGLEVIEIRINYRDTLDSQAKIDAHLARIKNPVWSGREIPIPMALVVRNLLSAKPDAKPEQVPFLMSDYGITGTPTAVLIDRQGRVSGPLQFRSKFDEALLKKVLGQK